MGEWQTRLANALTNGNTAALPEVLVLLGALIGCSLFTLIQFFTMLATRWGDKNPAFKSFMLSIMVHVIVGLAWSTAIAIRPMQAKLGIPEQPGESIPIQAQLNEEQDDHFDPDTTPLWQQFEAPKSELTRQQRSVETPADVTETPRMPVEPPPVDTSPTELSNLSLQPSTEVTPTPKATSAARLVTTPADNVEPITEQPVAESREESGVGSVTQRTQRTKQPLEDDADLPQTRGSADLTATQRPDDPGLSIPLDATEDQDEAPIPSGETAETIRKGAAAPTPSDAPEADFVPEGRTDQTGKPGFNRTRGSNQDKTRKTQPGNEPVTARNQGANANLNTDGTLSERMLNPKFKSGTESSEETPTPTLSKGNGPQLPNRSPATYKLRQLEKRRGTALKNGGSLESEKAVENSLKWLAKVQEKDGRWDADKYGGGKDEKDPDGHFRDKGGTLADSGVTGLALLAFMGAGYTTTDGDYADNVQRAITWLILQQRVNGYLGGDATHYDRMYCHAIATFALGEACGMMDAADRPPELKRALRLAVNYLVDQQCEDGGWRYKKEDNGDVSMFGWQLMALKSADIAGVSAPNEVWSKMIEFLKQRSQGKADGLAGYNMNLKTKELSPPTPAMTAEALFCKQMIGIRRTNPACLEAVGYLLKYRPHITKYDEYYWYYGTLAMFQHGGQPWDDWNTAQRDLLIQLQETRGNFAGSWEPNGKWAGIGGRIYSTALATLCLEVYYRYLPLYQSNQE